MKKLIALVLALAMVATLGLAFADVGTGGLSADTSISISGLDTGDSASFYQVLTFSDSASTTGGWVNAANVSLTDAEIQKILGLGTDGKPATITDANRAEYGINSTLAGKIAAYFAGKTANYTADENEGTATVTNTTAKPLVPGLYCVLVTPAKAGTVYNPVFVACDYARSNSETWAIVNMEDTYSDAAMAKKIGIVVTKTAEEASEAANETNGAKAVGVGDTINYTISTTIPEFADNYTSPLFVVSDTLSAGLTLVKNITVSGSGITENDYDITYPSTGPDFKITFKPASLKALSASTAITITYSATVTEDAVTNVNEEDNTVIVEFSHSPEVDEEGEGTKVGDKTHHYTFTIDGEVWGSSQSKTTEVVKIGLDKNGNEITQTTTLYNGKKIGALEGAEFELYINSNHTTKYNKGALAGATIVSDSEGRLKIKGSSNPGIPGLDAGEYWLVETKAPEGYIKAQNPIHIEIIPTFYGEVTWTEGNVEYKSDDLLKSYIVKVDSVTTATYTVNYETMNAAGTLPTNDHVAEDTNNMYTGINMTIGNTGPITTVPADIEDGDDDGKIKNTQGVELPSTGGIGTTIFYILGGLLVVGAAVILVARRKASN